MYRWFVLMDVSNCTQHIHQRNPDSKQFEAESDDRLEWNAATFLDYLEDMKRHCLAKQFLTKETHAALILGMINVRLKELNISRTSHDEMLRHDSENAGEGMETTRDTTRSLKGSSVPEEESPVSKKKW
ncbi:hypothetical protein HPB49_009361 [Dermacentor silvarum]|uniref:Uncharacterized protein n=1 Tax=Dermacentor silvarum TaxID=543639 RepID=A0ACB8CQR6_DERSI|nr:hypothetical protein HPB49_009361 [Dermacentor silvarum]